MDNDLIPGIGIKAQIGELKEYKEITIEDLHRLVKALQDETVVPSYKLDGKMYPNWVPPSKAVIFDEIREHDRNLQRKFMYGLTDEEIDKTNI